MTYGNQRLGKMRLLLHEILKIIVDRFFSEFLEAFTEKTANIPCGSGCYFAKIIN